MLRRHRIPLLVLVLLSGWASPASAQFRFVIGETQERSRLGPIVDRRLANAYGERLVGGKGFVEVAERARHGGELPASVGFRYHVFVIGLPIRTWGGEYYAYLASRDEPISRATAAQLLGVPEATLTPPFFYRVPMGVVGYPLTLVVGLPIMWLLARRKAALERRSEQAYLDSFTAIAGGSRTHACATLQRYERRMFAAG